MKSDMCERVAKDVSFWAKPLFWARVALGCAVVMMAVGLVSYAKTGYFCADALECTFQAVEMQQTGTLFPRTWTATNFAHLQVLPLFFGLAFSSSYAVANAVCGLVMFLLSLVSLAVFRRSGARDSSGLLLALFYVAPASGLALMQFFTGAFYAQFVCCILLTLTAWLAGCFRGDCEAFRTRPAGVALALAVTFGCCALTGMRMLLVICIPLAGAVAWMSVFDRPFVRGDARWRLVGLCAAGLAVLSGALGCLVYERVVAPAFGVPASVACADGLLRIVDSADGLLSNATALVEGALRALGFPFGHGMTSARGILGLVGFAFAVCVVLAFPIRETFACGRLDSRSRFLVVVTWLSVAGTVFILLSGNLGVGDEGNMCARYLLLPGVLLLLLGARYAYRTFFLSEDVRRRIVAIGLVLGCLSCSSMRLYETCRDHRRQWTGLLSLLERENLRRGYGTYENALSPTFYSNGRVRIPHVSVGEGRLSVPGWCVAERWYDARDYEGPTFLMLTDGELARYAPRGLKETLLGEPRRILKEGRYTLLVYDHDISRDLFGTMRDPVKYLWGFGDKWVCNGYAKMEVLVPEELRGKAVELRLQVVSGGERTRIFCGENLLGSFHLTDDRKDVRLRVPAQATAGGRISLRFEVTGAKSMKERGWSNDKTKVGPKVESVVVRPAE